MKTNLQIRDEVNKEIIQALKRLDKRTLLNPKKALEAAGNLSLDIAISKTRIDCIESMEKLYSLDDDAWSRLKEGWLIGRS